MCFFFQAEDGIRDSSVTGVQTCALPIFAHRPWSKLRRVGQAGSSHNEKSDQIPTSWVNPGKIGSRPGDGGLTPGLNLRWKCPSCSPFCLNRYGGMNTTPSAAKCASESNRERSQIQPCGLATHCGRKTG